MSYRVGLLTIIVKGYGFMIFLMLSQPQKYSIQYQKPQNIYLNYLHFNLYHLKWYFYHSLCRKIFELIYSMFVDINNPCGNQEHNDQIILWHMCVELYLILPDEPCHPLYIIRETLQTFQLWYKLSLKYFLEIYINPLSIYYIFLIKLIIKSINNLPLIFYILSLNKMYEITKKRKTYVWQLIILIVMIW